MKIVFQFRGADANAQSVEVTGSWLEWNERVPLSKLDDNSWKSEEITVPAGHIEYKFIVDRSRWMLAEDQPKCTASIGDSGVKVENNWKMVDGQEDEKEEKGKEEKQMPSKDIVGLVCDAVSNLFSSSSSSSSTSGSLPCRSDSVVNAAVSAAASAIAIAVEKEKQEQEEREWPDNADIVDGDVEKLEENVEKAAGEEERANKEKAVIPYQSARLHPFPDYLGYKIVHFCRRKDGSGQVTGVWALLHLQIPQRPSTKIFFSEIQGKRVEVFPPRDGMRDKTKYCTTHAQVIGVQFFGNAVDVKYALLNYQCNRGHLVSGFGGGNRMQYKLGRMHFEPRAGNPGTHCSYGLHFFLDSQSGLEYGGFSNPAKYYAPVVAKVLTKSRGFVADMDDELFQRQTHNSSVAATTSASVRDAISFTTKEMLNDAQTAEKKSLLIISLVYKAQQERKKE